MLVVVFFYLHTSVKDNLQRRKKNEHMKIYVRQDKAQ